MPDNRLQDLFHKYYNKTATAAEREELQRLLREAPGNLTVLLREAWEELPEDPSFFATEERSDMLKEILQIPGEAGRRLFISRSQTWRMAAAAILLLACLAGGYRWYVRSGETFGENKTARQVPKDIPPGGNKAVLILANGSSIVLDSAADGQLSTQGGTRVLKQQGGQLAYQQTADASGTTTSEKATMYNTIATPKGGQYKIVLADGTRVWLNAASSIRFPTAFNGTDRTVTISGEAYLEVARDKSKPFRVQANGTTVEVLGTDFNIMAYDDEKVLATTLLEGSVRVVNGNDRVLISPGEQAALNKTSGALRVAPVDTSEAVAWKNGQFTFNDQDLPSIVRQLSRWYDIDVQFNGNIAPRAMRGSISRNYNISEVLKMLAYTAGIRYTITDGKVIINQN